MDKLMLDGRSLRSFVALAEELHFGRAADRLALARSALSAQLSRLEDVLGTRLLDRNRRSAVTLTRAGQTFLVEARAAIAGLERAERIGAAAGRLEAGPLRLGYVFTAGINGVLTQALRALQRGRPMVDVVPTPTDTPEQIAAIADGKLDIGFLRPRSPYPLGLSARVIHREPLLLVHGADHALRNRARIAATDLRRERFIVPQLAQGGELAQALRALFGNDERPADMVEARDFVSAVNMAAAGSGVVLGPCSLRRLPIAGACFRAIDGFDGHVSLALAWRVGEFDSIAALIADDLAGGAPQAPPKAGLAS